MLRLNVDADVDGDVDGDGDGDGDAIVMLGVEGSKGS